MRPFISEIDNLEGKITDEFALDSQVPLLIVWRMNTRVFLTDEGRPLPPIGKLKNWANVLAVEGDFVPVGMLFDSSQMKGILISVWLTV